MLWMVSLVAAIMVLVLICANTLHMTEKAPDDISPVLTGLPTAEPVVTAEPVEPTQAPAAEAVDRVNAGARRM